MAAVQSPKVQVFIVYAHNPDEYTQLLPPERAKLDREVAREFSENQKHHEAKMRERIRGHEKLVKTFATFLERNGVTAVLDQQIGDLGTDNLIRWTHDNIDGSKFVILIITKSFVPFLEGKPRPPKEEFIFNNDYLYNKIHCSGDKGPKFIPVFLNQKKDLEMLPVALRASSVYEVHEDEISGTSPLDVSKCSDGLLSLYCRITGQNRYDRPCAGPPITLVSSTRRPFGPKLQMTGYHREMFERLSRTSHHLTERAYSKLSEDEAFSNHWRSIGAKLGLSTLELDQCASEQHRDTSEQCIQMFGMVARKDVGVSVARLADAVRAIEQYQLFETIQMYLQVV